jgi:hypothetical protein
MTEHDDLAPVCRPVQPTTALFSAARLSLVSQLSMDFTTTISQ